MAAPAPQGKEVSPVTVYARTDAPKVVKSYPAAGQVLSAGVLVLSVTFDQSMMKSSFNVGPTAGGEMPSCLKTPRLLDDSRTFVFLCTTQPNKAYALSFNDTPEGGFENVSEHRAAPSTLAFTTTDANGPNTLREAMKAAGLRPIDMPIQEAPDRRGDKTGR